jgi:hypothetical protein
MPSFRKTTFAALLAAGLLALMPAGLDGAGPPKPQLTERIAAKLAPLKDLVDASDYAAVLRLVEELIPGAGPESFDRALLSQIHGQVLLNLKRHADAIAPLELSLELGDRHAYFDTEATLNTLHTLSQIYFEKAGDGRDPGERRRHYDLAYARIKRWLALTPKPTSDAQLYAATILYSSATLDAAHPDLEKIRRAKADAEAALLLRDKPDEQALVLIVAAQQQLGRLRESADILETLAALKPSSAIYWQQLFSTYSGLAAEPGLPPGEIRRLHLRALLTLERARAHGFLSTPQDYFNIIALHNALGQHTRVARLLEQGLADGTIAGSRRNWELLANAWQQQRDPGRAIEALTRAAAALPDDGEIEYALARLYHAEDKPAETYAHLRAAVARGRLAHPGQAWFFLTYVAYELRLFEEAARYAGTAADHPDVSREDITRLAQAIQDALAEKNTAPASPASPAVPAATASPASST